MDSTFPLHQRLQFKRFLEGEPPVSGPQELTRRRVFILPTSRGLGLASTIFLLLLTAFIYNNNLIYLLAFFLASIFFVTILHTYKALAGLRVWSGNALPVFVGDMAHFAVTVDNPSHQIRPGLTARLNVEQEFRLEAYASNTLTLLMPTCQRGWQSMTTVTLATTYPLGIFRAWSPIRFHSKVLVYPRPSDSPINLSSLGREGLEVTGERTMNRKGDQDFSGLRSYQPGDSIRQIHWRSYAKGQGLMSKQYLNEVAGNELWLEFDKTAGENLEDRLSHLCRGIIDAENLGLRYGLRLPSLQLAPGRGQTHQVACLEALALFQL